MLKLTPPHSRARQDPPNAAILLPLLRVVPVPDELSSTVDRALRGDEEAFRLLAETAARGQERGAPEGRGGGGG